MFADNNVSNHIIVPESCWGIMDGDGPNELRSFHMIIQVVMIYKFEVILLHGVVPYGRKYFLIYLYLIN